MGKFRLKVREAGVGTVLKSSEVRAILTAKAQRSLSSAVSSAPTKTGEYRGSLHLEQDTTDRAVVRVIADAPHSMVVEAKTGNLARALDSASGA